MDSKTIDPTPMPLNPEPAGNCSGVDANEGVRSARLNLKHHQQHSITPATLHPQLLHKDSDIKSKASTSIPFISISLHPQPLPEHLDKVVSPIPTRPTYLYIPPGNLRRSKYPALFKPVPWSRDILSSKSLYFTPEAIIDAPSESQRNFKPEEATDDESQYFTPEVTPEVEEAIIDGPSESQDLKPEVSDDHEDEEEFIRRINEAFKCGEKIARRLAHSMLIGPPGSGKSSLMDRLLHRKRRKFATSTDVTESIVTVEVRLDEKQSTFHAAMVIDGKWEEFKFNDSLFSHMTLMQSPQSTTKLSPAESDPQSVQLKEKPLANELSTVPTPLEAAQQQEQESEQPVVMTSPEPASSFVQVRLDAAMIAYLRKKHGSYKQFKKYLERGFSLYLRDTGGQVEFQEMLPLLIFGPSIFLFVFRIDLPFKRKFEVKYRQEDGNFNDYISSITIEEALLQCLATVDVMRKTEKSDSETRDPYVFIIGTHRDKLKKQLREVKNGPSLEEEICKLNLNLDSLLRKHGFNHLVSYAGNKPEHVMYTVDNTSESEQDFNFIRSRINAVITSRKEFAIQYPINYLLFCLNLQDVKDHIISLNDFKERARRFAIEGDGEVSKLLHFLCNRIGVIQHFDKDGVNHIVVNYPPFLYKKVILNKSSNMK